MAEAPGFFERFPQQKLNMPIDTAQFIISPHLDSLINIGINPEREAFFASHC